MPALGQRAVTVLVRCRSGSIGPVLVQVAEDRFLPAAEGVIGQRHRDRHVDPHHADIDPAGEIPRGVAVAGEDRGAVAVFVVHREPSASS
jgi:hypothetical protein